MSNLYALDETLQFLNEGYFSNKSLENDNDREEIPSKNERDEYHKKLKDKLKEKKQKEFDDRYNEDDTRKI